MPEGAPGTGSLFAGRPKSSRRRDTRLRRALYAVLAPVLATLGRALAATWRVRVRGAAAELDARLASAPGDPLLPAFLHRDLLGANAVLLGLRPRGFRLAWLISPSFDGEVPARIARRLGVIVVRGSATRTGVRALRDLQRAVKHERASAALAVDGPTGPPGVSKAGVVMLAQLSGAPILALGVHARPALRLPTWDRLVLPLPFARVTVEVAPPRAVARDLAPDALEPERARLDATLAALADAARR